VAFFRFLLYKSLAMRFGILLVIFSCLFSCSDIEKDRQVKKINVLTNSVDKLNIALTQNKISNVPEKKLAVYTVIKRIKSYYFTDTIDYQFAKKMNSYKVVKKSLKNLDGDYEKIRIALREEKIALRKLKSDVINGFGQREKYDDYISFEKNKTKKIKSLLDEYIYKKKEFTIAFDSLHPVLNDYSIRLEEKFKAKYP
jgi:tRNA U34 5-carboxymethylaminomethyl modifying enzyme MnmG/GidA